MAEEYNKGVCEERHVNIKETFNRLFNKVEKLMSRLLWFYVLAILTLAGVIANLVK
jgi:hypothetical protein